MLKFLILKFLFIILISSINSIPCGDREINNCKTCGTGILSDTCAECDEKSFPLFGNLNCFKCNDKDYGQVGCQGYCSSSQYEKFENVICEEKGCKTGYYNLNGFCTQCSMTSDNCTNCTYELSSSGKKEFKCLDCVGGLNGDLRIWEVDGRCHTCKIEHCLECEYIKGTKNSKCKKCEKDYFIDDKGKCSQCHNKDIVGGECYYCPNGTQYSDRQNCSCHYYYTLNTNLPISCVHCPDYCDECTYDKAKDSSVCSKCFEGYHLDSNHNCINCQDSKCADCKLDAPNKPICTRCRSGFYFIESICYECPQHCSKCIAQLSNINNLPKCSYCSPYYILNENTNICLKCPNNCPTCEINGDKNTCRTCDNNYVMNKNKLCEKCSENQEIGGIGCLKCNYTSSKNKCYECDKNYIFIINEFVCKRPEDIGLNPYCINATKIEDKYYCQNCILDIYVLITHYNGMKDCYPRNASLVNCLEANQNENGNRQCTKCIYNYPQIWSDEYNQTICDNKCAFGSFFRNQSKWCFECDSSPYGNPGCNASFGCDYISPGNQLNCYGCKVGYFFYQYQCFNCSLRDNLCIECHFDQEEDKFICDKCKDGFYFNEKTGKCELITYDEYPEITPGCVLSINNYTYYKEKYKCLLCKPGFFKTKDESCIYCRARKNGGPSCEECEYIKDISGNDTNEIKCKKCSNGLNFNDKCYNCEDEVGPGCSKCTFEGQKVVCQECKENYDLNSEGYCTNIQSYYTNIDYCSIYNYTIIKKRRLADKVKTFCLVCKDGYYKNEEGKCDSLSLEKCSIKSIIEFNLPIYEECKRFCQSNNYAMIDYKENNEKVNKLLKDKENLSIDSLEQNIKSIVDHGYLCLDNTGGHDNVLRKCYKAEYNGSDKNYKCIQCVDGYRLEENKCIQNNEIEKKENTDFSNCDFIETEKKYLSCETCHNNSDILVFSDKGNFCAKPEGELEGCISAKANTDYIKTVYNCTQCSLNYLHYFSKFFKRSICVGRSGSVERIHQLPSDAYKGIENDTTIVDGHCVIDEAFTPDGERCYLCNNKKVGMPGCKGSCTYSLERNNIIECEEDKCKEGYLEVSKGVCEPCSNVNKGCKFCEYDTKYPDNYLGLKRKRRFKCNECEDGYLKSDDGICHHCSELGFNYCDRCHNESNEFECLKCIDGYFLSNNGVCMSCKEPKVQGKNNFCIFCNDTDEGGIDGCDKCSSDNGKITCHQCRLGYTLLEENQTCLRISTYKELEQFPNCQQVSLDENDNYYCTKCFDNYNLLKDNNGERCVNNNFIVTPKANILKYCKESTNKGPEDKPRHSCEKCIENNILSQEKKEKGITITKITYSENSTSFCNISEGYNMLGNCSEALRTIDNEGNEIFTCNKCEKENKFIYIADRDIKICQYFRYDKKCMVKDCKTCKDGNNYFCSVCLLDSYEVNPVTGSCVKKMEKPPAVSWKDAFRLILNSEKIINEQDIYGPTLSLLGISSSQINSGHAFMVYLTFLVTHTRNLEEGDKLANETEVIYVPTICQVDDNYDETKNKVNEVIYECIGNRTGEDQFKEDEVVLQNIGLDNPNSSSHGNITTNNEFVKNSNFDKMISNTDLQVIINKDTSSFNFSMLSEIVTFEMEDVINQYSTNYIFDFTIYGKINKDLNETTLKAVLEFVEIDKPAQCDFNIRENQKADIKCNINLENYKEYKEFTFKTIEIEFENQVGSIFLNRFNEIKLVYEEKKVEEKKKKTDILKIILIIIAVILVVIIVIFIFILKKILSKKVTDNKNIISSTNQNNKNEKNMKISDKISFDGVSSKGNINSKAKF